jgi:REP element-mobilizing transposase RayT
MEMKRPLAKPAKESYRRRLPHIQREGKTLFITFSTYRRRILPESVRHLVIEHCLRDHENKYYLHGVVVMPDHVHMIITPLSDEQGGTYGLAEIMQGIKGASARSINKALGREGKVWQREYFDRILRSHEHAEAKVEYICQNPVRKGLVKRVDDYPWLWRIWVEGEK